MVNPYNAGLLIGAEVDVVLANVNNEPMCAEELFGDKKLPVHHVEGDHETDVNTNRLKPKRHMVRVFAANSHCRAYAIDNLWWCLKELVGYLKKRGHISHRASFMDSDKKLHTAGGHIRLSLKEKSIYDKGDYNLLEDMMTKDGGTKAYNQLIRNLHLTIGIVGTLLDRRPEAVLRRANFGAGKKKCIRHTDNFLTYQGLTNFWVFHPVLAHLMLGAARMAVFMALNNVSKDVCTRKDFSSPDIAKAIRDSDYDAVQTIWDATKNRYESLGHSAGDNPFDSKLVGAIDFLAEYGIGTLGNGVYNNWRMKRKKVNYSNHLGDLHGWESGVSAIFGDKHELHDAFVKTTK